MTNKRGGYGILGRPGGMCVARGRDREGVIRRSRPRLLKLSNLGLKIFGKDLDWESSTRPHLRWGGGFKRSAHSASPTKWLSWAGKLRKIKIISQFLIAQTLKNRASDGVWGVEYI